MTNPKRKKATVKLIGRGSGQYNRTAQYGAEYRFKTEEGLFLFWDTMTYFEAEIGEEIQISYTELDRKPWYGTNDREVKNVRRLKNNG